MPERAGDHYAHASASIVRSMPSVRLHDGRQPVAAENRDGSATKCRCSIGRQRRRRLRRDDRHAPAGQQFDARRDQLERVADADAAPAADHEVPAIHLFRGVHAAIRNASTTSSTNT